MGKRFIGAIAMAAVMCASARTTRATGPAASAATGRSAHRSGDTGCRNEVRNRRHVPRVLQVIRISTASGRRSTAPIGILKRIVRAALSGLATRRDRLHSCREKRAERRRHDSIQTRSPEAA